MRKWLRHAALFAVSAVLLVGCGAGSAPTPAASPAAVQAQGGYTAPHMAESAFHPDAAEGSGGVLVDTSCADEGIVAVSAQSEKSLKFQVIFGDTKYNYDLPGNGTPQCYVLQSGSGRYTLRVMENVTGTKYAPLYTTEVEAEIADPLSPYLRPSQMVNYNADSACVALAATLAAKGADEAGAVAAIYEYIHDNVSYDSEKAKTVTDGYLPDPDETLATGKGICFDYAALAAAMLRSQGIPTRLITGYVSPGDLYHAWNMIWLEETGWITVSIEAPANEWERIDLTFAAGADAAYTGDGTGYTDRYTY